jgi:hypothetical protein
MLSTHLESCYSYWMSNQSTWMKNLNLPYYTQLKELLWDEHIYPKLLQSESKWYERDITYRANNDESAFYKTITKNLLITKERSIQIFLTPEDPLHQRQVKDNGWLWSSLCARAKREYNLSQLV